SEPHTPLASMRTTASSGSIGSGSGRSSTLTTRGAWKVTARMPAEAYLPRHPCDRNCSVERAAQPIARNLRRWRMAREMTLSALAEQAGAAKSTGALIELSQGDLISFRADRPHSYTAVDGRARLVSVHEYPRVSLA